MTTSKSVIPEPPTPERNLPTIAIHKEVANALKKGKSPSWAGDFTYLNLRHCTSNRED